MSIRPRFIRHLRRFSIPALLPTVLVLSVHQPASSQTSSRVEVVAHVDPGPGMPYMDVWGYTAPDGTEIAILAGFDSVYFIDATQGTRSRVVFQLLSTASSHRDMRTYSTYAYAVNESGGGLEIVDLSNPAAPFLAAQHQDVFTSAHNIGIYEGYAYIAGAKKDGVDVGMRILDLSDPVNPLDVGAYTQKYAHDVYVRNDVAYVSTINNAQLTILDVSSKSSPVEIGVVPSGGSTHNAWLSFDGSTVLTTHESAGGQLRIWDIRNLQQPIHLADWSAHREATVHNVLVRGNLAYMSYYAEGLQVVDITNPTQPNRVAFFDTRPTNTAGFIGAWGVYPFTQNGTIYLSDQDLGLYVLRIVEHEPAPEFSVLAPETQTANPGDHQVLFSFDLFNGSSANQVFHLEASNTRGWPMQLPQTITVGPQGLEVVNVQVEVPGDLAESMSLDAGLCASWQRPPGPDVEMCGHTDPTVPVRLARFRAEAIGRQAVQLEWRLDSDGEAGELRLWRRDDTRTSHRTLATLPHAGTYRDEEIEPGHQYVYSLIWDDADGVVVLGERSLSLAKVPVSRVLGNWPNPFNPRTRIRFELARPGPTRIDLFDARGRWLRRLMHSDLEAGEHQVSWDGRDAAGTVLGSGVYWYAVRQNGWSGEGRMVLLR